MHSLQPHRSLPQQRYHVFLKLLRLSKFHMRLHALPSNAAYMNPSLFALFEVSGVRDVFYYPSACGCGAGFCMMADGGECGGGVGLVGEGVGGEVGWGVLMELGEGRGGGRAGLIKRVGNRGGLVSEGSVGRGGGTFEYLCDGRCTAGDCRGWGLWFEIGVEEDYGAVNDGEDFFAEGGVDWGFREFLVVGYAVPICGNA